MRDAFVKTDWKDANISQEAKKTADIIDRIENMDQVKSNIDKYPTIIYFYTQRKEKRNGAKKDDPKELTKQAKLCDLVEGEFEDLSFRFPTAAQFFKCYNIDMSNVTEEEDPTLNTTNCPLMVLTDYDGKVAKIFKGRFTAPGVAKAMYDILKRRDGGYGKLEGQITNTLKNMAMTKIEIEKAESALSNAKSAANAKLSGRKKEISSSDKAKIERAERKVKDLQSKYDAMGTDVKELLATTLEPITEVTKK